MGLALLQNGLVLNSSTLLQLPPTLDLFPSLIVGVLIEQIPYVFLCNQNIAPC